MFNANSMHKPSVIYYPWETMLRVLKTYRTIVHPYALNMSMVGLLKAYIIRQHTMLHVRVTLAKFNQNND